MPPWQGSSSPAASKPIKSQRIHGDWSVNLGSGAKVGAGRYPAKFSFNPINAPDCTNDFVVFNTGLAGAANQASIIAFNNLYNGSTLSGGCGTSGVPAVYWSYNTAGTISNSVVLSGDGSQIAFIQSGSPPSLVVLKLKGLQGTSASAPVTPDHVFSGSGQAASYASCRTMSPAASCQLSLTFFSSTMANDSDSSPFFDYVNDILYVGDDGGALHKFTGVFKSTPAEVGSSGSPWAVVDSNVMLTSPVLDSAASTPTIYVAEFKNGMGRLLYMPAALGPKTFSKQLGFNTNEDIADSPVVDSSSGKIYVAVSNDGKGTTPSSGVFEFNRGFSGGASGSEATIGTSTNNSIPVFDGDFDNVYFNSANGTGNLYICGNAGGNPTLYQVPVTTTGLGSAQTGPALASANKICSPVTEIYNPNASGGPFDWMFVSVQANGSFSNCSNGGCIISFVVTQWRANTTYALGQLILDTNLKIQKVTTAGTSGSTPPTWNVTTGGTTTDNTTIWTNQGSMSTSSASHAEAGGTSAIIIDNTSATAGASQVYFSTLSNAACGTGGTGGCAVQASQSGLQ